MAPRPRRDDEDEDDPFGVAAFDPTDAEDEEEEAPSPQPADAFAARRFVDAILERPIFAPAGEPDVLDLRSAARQRLEAAGLFGNALAPIPPSPAIGEAERDTNRPALPRSWKLPPSAPGLPSSILGDDTAFGPLGRTAAADTPASEIAAAPIASSVPTLGEGNATAPLDHPDARTGLALVAADTLLRRGAAIVTQIAGGNRELARQALDAAVAWIGAALPPEFRASAEKSGAAVLAESHRRMDEMDAAARSRAAIGTLANRRIEAEREHAEALIGDDRAKLAEARRDVVDAWRAERVARGDGPAEIDADARATETRLRATALCHRLAQLDDAGLEQALADDDDAKADPAAARRIAEDIRRTRREDPARAGEASIAREIEQRKRDGRIDTPEEETRARYALRWQAQARRGISEERRQLLTIKERDAFATEYLRIESQKGKAAADAWLEDEINKAGPYADRLRGEVASARAVSGDAGRPSTPGVPGAIDDDGSIQPAQDKDDRPPAQNGEPTPRPQRDGRFGDEVRDALRKRYPTAKVPKEEIIGANAEVAIRRGEMPPFNAMYVWGSLANDGPDHVRFAAADAITRIAREAPDAARTAFEPWQLEAAQRIVSLAEQELAQLDPNDPVYNEKQREILRRVHQETGAIFPPGFGEFLGGALAGASRGIRGGTRPHMIGAEGAARFLKRFDKAFAGSGLEVRIQQFEHDLHIKHGIRRRMDVHIVDPNTSRTIAVRYEIKTNSGRLTPNQVRADELRRQEGGEVHYVHVDLKRGKIKINGQDPEVHFEEIKRRLGR